MAILSCQGKGGHPFILGASFYSKLPKVGLKGGLRRLAAEFPAQISWLDQEDSSLCVNINTPEEYHLAFEAEPQFLPNSVYFVQ